MGIKKNINIEFQEVSITELAKSDQDLVRMATEASKKAYAPYSEFKVGAAVLLENGNVITGNNQENAAYPSGICAERVAIFKASADYPDSKVKTIAVTASSAAISIASPVSPCGACRQVLKEYENKFKNKIKIILAGEKSDTVYIIEGIEDLLPFSFKSEDIKKHNL